MGRREDPLEIRPLEISGWFCVSCSSQRSDKRTRCTACWDRESCRPARVRRVELLRPPGPGRLEPGAFLGELGLLYIYRVSRRNETKKRAPIWGLFFLTSKIGTTGRKAQQPIWGQETRCRTLAIADPTRQLTWAPKFRSGGRSHETNRWRARGDLVWQGEIRNGRRTFGTSGINLRTLLVFS